MHKDDEVGGTTENTKILNILLHSILKRHDAKSNRNPGYNYYLLS